MALAGELAAALAGKGDIAQVRSAAPGFINLTMRPAFWQRQVRAVLAAGPDYGRSDDRLAAAASMSSSARPTRPARCMSAMAAAPCSATRWPACWAMPASPSPANTTSTTAARRSRRSPAPLHLRYREALGEAIGEIPSGLYPGDYLKPVAAEIAARDGDRWLAGGEAEWLEPFSRMGVDAMLALIRGDLAALGVRARCLHLRAPADRRRPDRRGAAPCSTAWACSTPGTLPPPKGGKPDADWEPVPQLLFRSTEYRRRDRPPAQALERRLDLLRRRHRLSPRQVPPRLSGHGRRLGRRSWRLHQADAGGGPCRHRGRGLRSTSASASWSTCSTAARR